MVRHTVPTAHGVGFIASSLRGWGTSGLHFIEFFLIALGSAEFFEHLGFDVAAGDDGDVEFCFWKLIGVEEESGGGDCSAGLRDGFGIYGEQFQCVANLVFADGDNGIDETLHVVEIDCTDALGAESVGDGA